jgi:hypothetical protein
MIKTLIVPAALALALFRIALPPSAKADEFDKDGDNN